MNDPPYCSSSDTTPPSQVTGLNGTAVNAGQINLSWNAATDPESGVPSYRVYRDRVLVGTATHTSFDNTGLLGETTYSYQVAAVNGVGLEGPKSSAVQATTPTATGGGGLVPCGEPGNPCSFCHLFALVKNILDMFIFPIVPVLASLLIAVGGFFMMTAAGNSERLNRGRTVIFAVVVGLLIVYGAWLLISLLLDALGFATFGGVGNWWEITC